VGRDAILMTGWNSLFYMASSIVPYVLSVSVSTRLTIVCRWYIVDTLGRRPILLGGAAGVRFTRRVGVDMG
jgi:hypothetical protein